MGDLAAAYLERRSLAPQKQAPVEPPPVEPNPRFPWGAEFGVPALIENGQYLSRTPCHHRRVRVEEELAAEGGPVVTRCPTCSRLWEVRFPSPGDLFSVARWTA